MAVHGLLPAQSTFEDDIRELADSGILGKWIRYKFNPDLTFSKRGFHEAAMGLLREISNSRQGAQQVIDTKMYRNPKVHSTDVSVEEAAHCVSFA